MPDRESSTEVKLTESQRAMLVEVVESQSTHTGELAVDLGLPPGTARCRLDALESFGLVEGFKVDERDTLHNGRKRIYWSPTAAGREVLSGA